MLETMQVAIRESETIDDRGEIDRLRDAAPCMIYSKVRKLFTKVLC